jgi:signal transduction histidine kinase
MTRKANQQGRTINRRPDYNSMMRRSPLIERIEAQALRRQQAAFCVLTLVVIAALLLLHTYFASLLGEPSRPVILLLTFVFLAKILELVWLWRQKKGISETAARIETAASMVGIFLFAGVLAVLTDRDDAPYFVLLSIPILQCAYRFGFLPTLLTIAASITMIFSWSQHFFRLHPPARPTEFLEAGMISVIYCLMGMLVWYLVKQLEEKQAHLYRNMTELESTREKLAKEERLAAVGRLASGIAHEIRNPVAMIASSLATAAYPSSEASEREEMFAIAAREAKRLEFLTNDFLTYARPSPPQRTSFLISDILRHVANMTRVRAADRSIEVHCEPWDDLALEIDATQVESALVNLGFNAIDATPDHGRITFRTQMKPPVYLIEIENSGRAIPEDHLLRIFEPFFTTKPTGTGLGLAIAKTVANAHEGEVWVSENHDGSVTFSMTLQIHSSSRTSRGGG